MSIRSISVMKAAAASWTPNSISDIELWWDFSNNGSLTSAAGLISAVADQTSNGNNGVSPAAHQPTIVTNFQNGLQVAQFGIAGLTSYITRTLTSGTLSTFTVASLIYPDYDSRTEDYIWGSTTTTTDAIQLVTSTSGNHALQVFVDNRGVMFNSANNTFPISTWARLVNTYSTPTYKLYNNDVDITGALANNTSKNLLAAFGLGSDGATAAWTPARFHLGEILITRSPLSAGNLTSLASFWKTKWSVS